MTHQHDFVELGVELGGVVFILAEHIDQVAEQDCECRQRCTCIFAVRSQSVIAAREDRQVVASDWRGH